MFSTRHLAGLLIAGWLWAAPLGAQTTQPEPVAPEVERVLDRAEARGRATHSLKAKMHYEQNQTLADEIITRDGSVVGLRKWEGDPPAAQRERVFFRIQFDTLKTPDRVSTKKEILSFDGRWLHELNWKTRMLIHREIVPEGQLINPIRLGQGPFPAPFWQTKQDVLANFIVTLVPSGPKDPSDTDQLLLVPRPGTDLARTYKSVRLYVSRTVELPVRLITVNKSEVIVTVDFSDIQVNPSVDERDFVLTNPGDFAETTERLQPSAPPR